MSFDFSESRYSPEDVIEMYEYRLANEAFRYLPALLADKHNITVIGQIIRRDFGRSYVKLLADAEHERTKLLIVGDVKAKLESKHFDQLRRKIKRVAVSEELNGRLILPMFVVLHAPESELRRAERRGVLIVQSWEW